MATQLCPRCGAEVNENAEYCKTCGTPLGQAKPEAVEPKAEDVKVEAAQLQAEPVEAVKAEAAEPQTEPVEEVKAEPVEEVKAEPAEEVKTETAEPETDKET